MTSFLCQMMEEADPRSDSDQEGPFLSRPLSRPKFLREPPFYEGIHFRIDNCHSFTYENWHFIVWGRCNRSSGRAFIGVHRKITAPCASEGSLGTISGIHFPSGVGSVHGSFTIRHLARPRNAPQCALRFPGCRQDFTSCNDFLI